jgi:hypothetical protein
MDIYYGNSNLKLISKYKTALQAELFSNNNNLQEKHKDNELKSKTLHLQLRSGSNGKMFIQ